MACLYVKKYELGVTKYINHFPEAYDKSTKQQIQWHGGALEKPIVSKMANKFLTHYGTENLSPPSQ